MFGEKNNYPEFGKKRIECMEAKGFPKALRVFGALRR
jgi:hypothetical protein